MKKPIDETGDQEALEWLAGELYERYSKAVGGKNFKGDPLPGWVDFRADPAKKLQSDAWIEVAKCAEEEIA